jgi:hypothetical protein
MTTEPEQTRCLISLILFISSCCGDNSKIQHQLIT